MQTDYHIEDLVHQTDNLVVYRVVTREDVPLALVRLEYEPEVLAKFAGGVFENALAQLKQLNHNCLRPVLDGGLDPVDGYPWIVARWWDGLLIPDRVRDSDLTAAEFNRIKFHGETLIHALGEFAGAVSFTPGSIVTCGEGEQAVDTFSIDYHTWFAAFAWGVHPTAEIDPYQKFNALLTYLKRNTEFTPNPLATGSAPTSQPAPVVPLPTVSSSTFPLKILLVLVTLLAAIGFFSWKFLKKPPAQVVEKETRIITPTGESSLPTGVIPPTPPAPTITPKDPTPARPVLPPTKRPTNRNAFLEVDPTSPYSLDGKVGKWITFQSAFSGLENGLLLVRDSEIKVSLPMASRDLAHSALRNETTVWGFLSSPTLLRITHPDDLQITYLLQEFYTIHDERQIRSQLTQNGQIIPVRGLVTALTKSSSGKTLYLQFKENPPEFAAAIELKKSENSLSESYLESLVGKTIQVKGRPRNETTGSRLSLAVTKKSQIKVIE